MLKKKLLYYLLVITILVSAFFSGFIVSAATPVTYYISYSSGSDSNNGTSASTPWKTLAKASTVTYNPGDSILLKCGDTWTGDSLLPLGSGTPSNPILISSYGTGNRPVISPGIGVKTYGIRLVDNDGYKITNLEICNCYGGIVTFDNATYNHNYLDIENCYIHDITGKDTGFVCTYPVNGSYVGTPTPDLLFGTGISIAGTCRTDEPTFNNITINNCTFNKCDTAIDMVPRNEGDLYCQYTSNCTTHNFNNINITNCNITQSYRTGGIVLYCTDGGCIDNCYVDQTGYQVGMWWGTCAIQMAEDSNYTVENSEMADTQRPSGSPDGEGFDFEAGNVNVTLFNCYIHDNVGPAILMYGGNAAWNNGNSNNVVDTCNLANNNSTQNGGDIVFLMGTSNNSGTVKNCNIHLYDNSQTYSTSPVSFDPSNVVYNSSGTQVYGTAPLFYDNFSGDLSKWTNTSNCSISNGKLSITNNEYLRTASGGSSWNDYSVDADVTITNANAGIAFRSQDNNNFYLWEFGTTGLLTTQKKVNGSWTTINQDSGLSIQANIPFHVRIEAVGSTIKTYINGSLVDTSTDSAFSNGNVGFREYNTESATFDNICVESMTSSSPSFSDNFESGNSNSWTVQTGSWSVVTDGSYVYKQTGTAASMSTAGSASWTDYSVSADVKRLSSNSQITLVGRYLTSDQNYEVELSGSQVQIWKASPGGPVWTELSSANFTANINTFYTLKIAFNGSLISAYVNGTLECSATDSSYSSGEIGLKTYQGDGEFDNVSVSTNGGGGGASFSDNFESGNSNNWTVQTGSWSVVTDGSYVYKQTGTAASLSTAGNSSWTNYSVSSDAKLLGSGMEVTVIGRYQSSSAYYEVDMNGTQIQIWKVTSGMVWTELASANFTANTNTFYTLKLTLNGTAISAYVNGTQECSATDSTYSSGCIGLKTNAGNGEFDNVSVTS